MTLQELYEMLKMTGFPVAYSHFNKRVKPPFICYLVDHMPNIASDYVVHKKRYSVIVELYTSKKDLKSEQQLEAALAEHGITYDPSFIYIKDENIFQARYEFII